MSDDGLREAARMMQFSALSNIQISEEQIEAIRAQFEKLDRDAYLDALGTAMSKLQRFGTARNRAVDRDTRDVTLTDDEALAILFALEHPPTEEDDD